MTETVIIVLFLMLIISTSNVMCFFIGARVGQKVINKEPLKITSPAEKIREHKAKKEEKAKLDRYSILMENIEKYDGTGIGQKDVPEMRD